MEFNKDTTLLLCAVLFIFGGTNGYPTNITTYDQRQTGDLNIQISVSDLKIIALLGSGLNFPEDYDYNYDYAELTIKPTNQNKTTTPAPTTTTKSQPETNENVLTTTEKVVQITPPSPVLHPKPVKPITQNITNVIKIDSGNKSNVTVSTQKPGNLNSSGIPVQILTTPVEIVYNHKEVTSSTTLKPEVTFASVSGTTGDKQADCIEGFRKDRRGNCRPKIRKPTQQTLLRKLIQLSHRMQNPANKKVHSAQ